MKITIFLQDENAVWLKGNLHSHSTMSDGRLTPEEMKEAYKHHGYDFLVISDHDRYTNTKNMTEENFTMVQFLGFFLCLQLLLGQLSSCFFFAKLLFCRCAHVIISSHKYAW